MSQIPTPADMFAVLDRLHSKTYHSELYDTGTPRQLIDFFEQVIADMLTDDYFHLCGRYCICYGNTYTGCASGECCYGHIILQGNPVRFAIKRTVHRDLYRIIRMNSIVKIVQLDTNTVIYRHPLFHIPDEPPPAPEVVETQQRAARNVTIRKPTSGQRNA